MIFALAAVLMLVSSVTFVSAGEPAMARRSVSTPATFAEFMTSGLTVLRTDGRFRVFLFTQWLGGATFMALPFYVVAATGLGLGTADVAILLGA